MRDLSLKIEAGLTQRSAEGTDIQRLSYAAASIWRELDQTLAPVIGQRGVTALFNRGLFLTCTRYPWLAAAEKDPVQDDFAKLRNTLSSQSAADIAAACGTLLQTFFDLLANLIGEQLTMRLLGSVLDRHSSPNPVQEHSK